MQFLSSSVVATTEESDRLVFTVKSESGWVDSLLPPIILVVFGLLLWKIKAWWLLIACAFGLVMFFIKWSRRTACSLSVSSFGIIVTPDIKRFPNRVTRYKPHIVQKLRFSLGNDESDPSGLYLNDDCVLSGIREDQAEEIANRIFAKFPDIGGPDTTRASILHGDDSGITSLGLIR
jgi:hypothetical protein